MFNSILGTQGTTTTMGVWTCTYREWLIALSGLLFLRYYVELTFFFSLYEYPRAGEGPYAASPAFFFEHKEKGVQDIPRPNPGEEEPSPDPKREKDDSSSNYEMLSFGRGKKGGEGTGSSPDVGTSVVFYYLSLIFLVFSLATLLVGTYRSIPSLLVCAPFCVLFWQTALFVMTCMEVSAYVDKHEKFNFDGVVLDTYILRIIDVVLRATLYYCLCLAVLVLAFMQWLSHKD